MSTARTADRTGTSGIRTTTASSATTPSRTGTICTPWDGVRIRAAAPTPVSFSHLPAPRTAAAVAPQRLRTPWDAHAGSDAELVPVPVPVRPVSFSSLAAPVGLPPVPTQRPAPLDG